MRLERKSPLIETAAARGPYRIHRRLDWSCDIDSEVIPFGSVGFESQLLEDMRHRAEVYLSKHYPELVFQRIYAKKTPKDVDYKVSLPKDWWMIAKWRTT